MFDIKSPNAVAIAERMFPRCTHSIRSVTIVYDRLSNSSRLSNNWCIYSNGTRLHYYPIAHTYENSLINVHVSRAQIYIAQLAF